jgi:phosphatidylglycerol:prolipoprotein diacylglycerol transferase
MVGGLVGCWLFARRNQLPVLHLFDLMAFCAPLGIVFGRLANFVNGELYGRPSDASYALAVKFPQELLDRAAENPLPFETTIELVNATRQANLPLRPDPIDQAFALIDAVQARSPEAMATVEPILTARHPSQLYAAALEGLMVFAVLLVFWAKAKKPGSAAAVFAIAYSVGRVVNEYWRLPDAQFIADDGTLPLITRGQWLSGLLLLAGVVLLIIAQRRKVEPLGGWRCQVCKA